MIIKHTVRQVYSLAAAVLVPATAWAHPGHGNAGDDWSLRHYLTQPDHILGALALLLVLAIAVPGLRRVIRARSATANAKAAR